MLTLHEINRRYRRDVLAPELNQGHVVNALDVAKFNEFGHSQMVDLYLANKTLVSYTGAASGQGSPVVFVPGASDVGPGREIVVVATDPSGDAEPDEMTMCIDVLPADEPKLEVFVDNVPAGEDATICAPDGIVGGREVEVTIDFRNGGSGDLHLGEIRLVNTVGFSLENGGLDSVLSPFEETSIIAVMDVGSVGMKAAEIGIPWDGGEFRLRVKGEVLPVAELECQQLVPVEVASPMSVHNSGAMVASDGMIYLWTGYPGNPRVNVLERYDPGTDSWTRLANTPAPRNGPGYFALDGYLFSIGGEGPRSGRFTNSVHRYDPAADQWQQSSNYPTNIWEPMAIVHDGRAYVIGGRPGYGATLPNCYQYDAANDAWLPLSPLPTSVQSAGIAAHEDKIYIFGGNHKVSEASDEHTALMQVYDIPSDTWTQAPIPWVFLRPECLPVAGGVILIPSHVRQTDGSFARLTSTYHYDYESGNWTECPFESPVELNLWGGTVPVIDGVAYLETTTGPNGGQTTHLLRMQLEGENQPYTPDENTWALFHFDGDLQDSSGNGRHLSANNPEGFIQFVESGLGDGFGMALHISESSNGWNNQTRISSPEIRYPGSGSWTVEALAYFPDPAISGWTGVNIIQHYSEHRAGHEPFTLAINDGNARWETQPGAPDQRWTLLGALGEANRWHHIAGVYDETQGRNFLYVDGVLVAEQAAGRPENLQQHEVYIGGSWFGVGGPMWLDELRISNVARPASELIGSPSGGTIEDVDRDGMLDQRELEIVGHNPDDEVRTVADVEIDADFDGDDLANGIEIYSGTSSVSATDRPTFEVTLEGGQYRFRYRRAKSATGLIGIPCWSEDLSIWIGEGLAESIVADLGDAWLVEATLPAGGRDRVFFKLLVRPVG